MKEKATKADLQRVVMVLNILATAAISWSYFSKEKMNMILSSAACMLVSLCGLAAYIIFCPHISISGRRGKLSAIFSAGVPSGLMLLIISMGIKRMPELTLPWVLWGVGIGVVLAVVLFLTTREYKENKYIYVFIPLLSGWVGLGLAGGGIIIRQLIING